MDDRNAQDFYPGDVPRKPGVYVFRDRTGKVIYVGKAADLRTRLSQYFQKSRKRMADPRLRSLINSIASWACYPVKNETEALVLEARYIKEYAPRYNILLRDDKRFLLIKLNPRERFPRLQLVRIRKDDAARYFGPFPQGGVLRQTVEFLTRHFGLRACHPEIPGPGDHRHCLRSIVRDCCAPCVGKSSEAEYRTRVNRLLEVLDGNPRPLINELETRMREYSSRQNFEKAAEFRDMISNLRECFGKRNRSFRFASIPSEVGNDAVDDLREALGLSHPPTLVEAFDISNIGGQLAVASMVVFRDGHPARELYRRFRIREVSGSDDFAMMREAVGRHYKKLLRENGEFPDLLIVDGGKGQLNAALERLIELDVPPLPVLGLAKKREEIFLPGRTEALILDRHRPALKMLQALRDEAHRFAISYHRGLREKRLRESMLDEIPGIGERRKQAILRTFGSIRRLRQASPEEIAAKIPGIGAKFAETIHRHLSK